MEVTVFCSHSYRLTMLVGKALHTMAVFQAYQAYLLNDHPVQCEGPSTPLTRGLGIVPGRGSEGERGTLHLPLRGVGVKTACPEWA
ncbi:unnamed protein product [Leuciscus chuanchicus]